MTEQYYKAIETIRNELDAVTEIKDLASEFRDFTDMFLELFQNINNGNKVDLLITQVISDNVEDILRYIKRKTR